MKKIIAVLIICVMALSFAACSDNLDDTNNADNQDVNETQSVVDYSSFKASSETKENTLGEWNPDDFEKYGVSNIDKLNIGEMTYYTCSGESGVTVIWNNITDFDAITKYGENLFDKTSEHNGGNYSIRFDEDDLVWVLDQEYSSFNDACKGWERDFYYSDWYYEKDGHIIYLSYYGAPDLLSLRIYQYQ